MELILASKFVISGVRPLRVDYNGATVYLSANPLLCPSLMMMVMMGEAGKKSCTLPEKADD